MSRHDLISNTAAVWKEAFAERNFGRKFIISIVFLAAVLFSLTHFLQFVEFREGVQLKDPLLNLFTPLDLTWLTFILIYGALVLAIIYLVEHPYYLLAAIQTYTIMVVFRICAMYLMPLEAPASLIPLVDPFVEFFGGGTTLKNDLFFSGHTATLFILYLTAKNKTIKIIFLWATIFVAIAVILQHVHYTIDVFIAPFVSFVSYKLMLFINKK